MRGDPNDLPRAFGDYVLLRRLAVGGMAEVYVAKSKGIGGFEKLVAIKVIHPRFSEDESFVKLLVEEAKISVLLTHVNIGQIFDLGCVDGTYFIAMEYIEGVDAYRMLRKASDSGVRVPVDVSLFIASEMCAGLDYAHRKRDAEGRPLGIVHRDISPQNVLLSFAGEVKIVDFGIAKASSRSGQTEAGVIKGKFYYMSPEQAWADPLDARSDVFSTGIVLYELLTGEMLYREESVPLLLDKVRKAEILPPHHKRPDVPPEVSAAVMKALARKPEDRYQSAHEMGQALAQVLYQLSPSFTSARLSELLMRLFPAEGRRTADAGSAAGLPAPRASGGAKGPAPPAAGAARPTARPPPSSARHAAGRGAAPAAEGPASPAAPASAPRALAAAATPPARPDARFDLADDDDDRTRNELPAYQRARAAAGDPRPGAPDPAAARPTPASPAGRPAPRQGAPARAATPASSSGSATSPAPSSSAGSATTPAPSSSASSGARVDDLDFDDDDATTVGAVDAFDAAPAPAADPRAARTAPAAMGEDAGDDDFKDEATRVEDPGAVARVLARRADADSAAGASGGAPKVAAAPRRPSAPPAPPGPRAPAPLLAPPSASLSAAVPTPSARAAAPGLSPPRAPVPSRVVSPFDPVASVPPRPPVAVSWPPPPLSGAAGAPSATLPVGPVHPYAHMAQAAGPGAPGGPVLAADPDAGGARASFAGYPPPSYGALPGGAPTLVSGVHVADPFLAPPPSDTAAHAAHAARSPGLLRRFGWVGLLAAVLVAAAVAVLAVRHRAGHTLRIVSVPAGAAVTVDGMALSGTTPVEHTVDPAVEHRVEVSLDGFRPFVERTPAGRPPAMIVAVLERARVALQVRSTPPGALVFVDDEFVGNTPVQLERTAGPHVVTLRLPGYDEARHELRLDTSAPPPPLEVTLTPAGAAPPR